MKTPIACATIAGGIAFLMAIALGFPAPGKNTPVALIDGNCSAGRQLGDISEYPLLLRAQQNNMGYIRIRRDAHWDTQFVDNVLGTVPCGTILHGEGPLKDADEPGGIGYAVAVCDGKGNVCRGYVSYTVVEFMEGPWGGGPYTRHAPF